jgi:hypothetical protein
MNDINFTFSDLIAGYVTGFDRSADIYTGDQRWTGV